MASCVADTSWLVGLVNRSDDHHAAATAEAARMERVYVPPVILAEYLSFIHGPANTAKEKREAAERQRRRIPKTVLISGHRNNY